MADQSFLDEQADEQRALSSAVQAVWDWAGVVHEPSAPDWEPDLNHAVAALVTYGAHLASGVSLLLNDRHYVAVGPLERALYEIWCEVQELIAQGVEGARKMIANSLLEMIELDSEDETDAGWEALYRAALAEIEKLDETAVLQVRKQRRRRRFHWSGRRRSEVMRRGSPSGRTYMALSWEGHAAHVAMRDAIGIALREDDDVRVYPASRADYMHPEAAAYRCRLYLVDMWNRYCDLLGVSAPNWP